MKDEPLDAPIAGRQRIMGVLARAAGSALEKAYAGFAAMPGWSFARRPETGLIMVRGRIGGGGAPFNLGEMSVTRTAVVLDSGEIGHAYVAGRNQRKAAIAAVFDALWQNPGFRDSIETQIIGPLAQSETAEDGRQARQIAATKVDFFTMVRGED